MFLRAFTSSSSVIEKARSIVVLIATDASASVATAWAASWTRVTATTWWVASRTMSTAVATRTTSRTWIYNMQQKNSIETDICIEDFVYENERVLHDRLLRVRLCERDRNDGGSGGFWSSACSARRKLPNLSRTDGPAGGCAGNCIGLFASYFEAEYEADGCDEDTPYGVCFGIFNESSWSSSSLGNAYFETGASFLLQYSNRNKFEFTVFSFWLKIIWCLPILWEHCHFPFAFIFIGLTFNVGKFLFSEINGTVVLWAND